MGRGEEGKPPIGGERGPQRAAERAADASNDAADAGLLPPTPKTHDHHPPPPPTPGNLISAGVREQIRFLVQHAMVDVVVTTAGGIEEDFIKCLGHTYVGDFALKGARVERGGVGRGGGGGL